MAIGLIELGTIESSTTGNTTELTLTGAAPAGAVLLLAYGYAASFTPDSFTFVDDGGHTWTLLDNNPLSYYVRDCNALAVGDKITFTHPRPVGTPADRTMNIAAALYAVTGHNLRLFRGVVDPPFGSGPSTSPLAVRLKTTTQPVKHRLALTLSYWRLPNSGIHPTLLGAHAITSPEFTALEDYLRVSTSWTDSFGTALQSNFNLAIAYRIAATFSDRPDYTSELTWTPTALNEIAGHRAYVVEFYELQERVSFVRSPLTEQLFAARINNLNAGYLVVDRCDDTETDTVVATATVDPAIFSEFHRPRVVVLSDGVLRVLYQVGLDIKIAVSRDNGRTWTVSSTVASNDYPLAAFAWGTALEGRPAAAVMLFRFTGAWFVRVGRVDLTGWSGFASIGVSGDAALGELRQARDGAWNFLYLDLAGAWKMLRCANLAANGSGTWTEVGTVASSGYDLVAFEWGTALDGRELPVAMLYHPASETWRVTVGSADLATWTVPVSIGVTAPAVQGELRQRRDGTWEFLYVASSGNWQIVRCVDLGADGAGTWS